MSVKGRQNSILQLGKSYATEENKSNPPDPIPEYVRPGFLHFHS